MITTMILVRVILSLSATEKTGMAAMIKTNTPVRPRGVRQGMMDTILITLWEYTFPEIHMVR